MILPFFFMTPFAIFFLRQFFLGISKEVEEAAKLDGASHSRIFFRIILPMSEAPITTLAILTYIGAWNEYFWPLLVATRRIPPADPRVGHLPFADPGRQPPTGRA